MTQYLTTWKGIHYNNLTHLGFTCINSIFCLIEYDKHNWEAEWNPMDRNLHVFQCEVRFSELQKCMWKHITSRTKPSMIPELDCISQNTSSVFNSPEEERSNLKEQEDWWPNKLCCLLNEQNYQLIKPAHIWSSRAFIWPLDIISVTHITVFTHIYRIPDKIWVPWAFESWKLAQRSPRKILDKIWAPWTLLRSKGSQGKMIKPGHICSPRSFIWHSKHENCPSSLQNISWMTLTLLSWAQRPRCSYSTHF